MQNYVKISTDKFCSRVLESEKPIYTISKLSKAIKRPGCSTDHLYSTLHGPTANDSLILWYKELVDGVVRRVDIGNDERKNQYTQPLYLYHGKTYVHYRTRVFVIQLF